MPVIQWGRKKMKTGFGWKQSRERRICKICSKVGYPTRDTHWLNSWTYCSLDQEKYTMKGGFIVHKPIVGVCSHENECDCSEFTHIEKKRVTELHKYQQRKKD